MKPIGKSLALAALLLGQCALAQSNANALQSRLRNVQHLIEDSSAARQVASGANAGAQVRREQAREFYAQAQARHAAGDSDAADTLLGKATKAMFEAVRLAGAPAVLEQKKQRDFAAREESVGVLVTALTRIGEEKGVRAQTAKAVASIEKLVTQAVAVRDQGDVAEARRTLDAAYVLAKRAIEQLRGGDTLVRSLHFETKEAEYHYELDRNDTHQMLVKVLTEEKRAARKGVDRMVRTFVDRALKLRGQAEQQAGRGEHLDAVKTLEQSTKELVRAIRSAGIYIPG